MNKRRGSKHLCDRIIRLLLRSCPRSPIQRRKPSWREMWMLFIADLLKAIRNKMGKHKTELLGVQTIPGHRRKECKRPPVKRGNIHCNLWAQNTSRHVLGDSPSFRLRRIRISQPGPHNSVWCFTLGVCRDLHLTSDEGKCTRFYSSKRDFCPSV